MEDKPDQNIKSHEIMADTFSIFSSEKRLKLFDYLVSENDDWTTNELAEELDVSRTAVQPYITDYKDAGLIESDAKEYHVTDRGHFVYETIQEFADQYTQLLYEETVKDLENLEDLLDDLDYDGDI